ncbi:MAG TPA: alpha/beta fold hydrolase [Thermoleophilaceae bacterium]|jgi:pimeloyl-ACP methyl ester carboxylesterase
MTRLARAVCCSLLLLFVLAPASHAAIAFEPCGERTELQCGTLTVPIDRSGSVPGTIKLQVTRVPAVKPSGKAVFAFAGGPGQGATPFADSFAAQLGRARRTHDIVVFDQRGTGASAPIDCTDVDRVRDIRDAAAQIRACGEKLGPTAPFYTTADTVQDIESIRAELGYEKIGLFGVSYGTKVELAYASTFPQRVSRMVLDSVVQADGPDPLLRDSFRAVPRVLRELCRSAYCRGVTTDPVADMAAAVARMSGGPLTGSTYSVKGKREAASISSSTLFTLLLIGDFETALRGAIPSAVRSAALGDPAPLLRMAKLIEPPPNPQAPELSEFSTGLWLATVCAELPFPWDPDAPESERRAQAQQRSAALDPAQFDPFDPGTALSWDIVEMCQHWPVARRPATGDLSKVEAPVLLVNGRIDLRTPLENAERMAALLPNATVLPIPEVGHSVSDADPTGCAGLATDDFLAGRTLVPCQNAPPRMRIRPFAPTDLNALSPSKGTSGKRGRTAKAVDLTIHDVIAELDLFYADRGGLRGGSFTLGDEDIVFRGLVYVPGVKVSGRLNAFSYGGTLRISGSKAARGTLRVGRKGAVTGVLDGRRISTRIKLPKPPEGLGGGGGEEGPGEPRVPTWLGPLLGR